MAKRIIQTFVLLMLLLPQMRAQQLTGYEYWFDDNVDERSYGAISGSTAVINTDIATGNLPVGVHKLHLRVKRSDGMYSPVTTSTFVKLPTGAVKYLEYWLDGDRSTVSRVAGHEASSGNAQIFNTELDLSNVDEGMHRLYCRAIGEDGGATTAVTMLPVMVKPRYEREKLDAVVNKYSMTVDDEPLVVTHVAQPARVVNIIRDLDLRDLQPGEHRLQVDVWNSAYANLRLDTTFVVTRPADPTLQLSAEQNAGLVNLRFNSIPNDVRWVLKRKDANGVSETVRQSRSSHYPQDVVVVDDPANGVYSYWVRVFYTDADGQQRHTDSNIVELTMTQTDQVRYGSIVGMINAPSGIGLNHRWLVRYSDNIEEMVDQWGSFSRSRIPVGSSIDITVEDLGNEGYEFDTQSIVVKQGLNTVNITGRVNVDLMNNAMNNDLQFASALNFSPGGSMSFKVKNVGQRRWSGKIRLLSVRKAYLDQSASPTNPGSGGVGAGNVASLPLPMSTFSQYVDYSDDYSDHLSLEKNQVADISIRHSFECMRGGEDEYYYFFVYGVTDGNQEQLVGPNNDYASSTANPLVQWVEKSKISEEAKQQVLEEDIEYAVNLILLLCKDMKELDGMLGKLETTSAYINGYRVSTVINDALTMTSMDEFKQKYPKESFANLFYESNSDFQNLVHSWRDEISTLVRASSNVLKVVKSANEVLDKIKLGYEVLNQNNELRIAASAARLIINAAGGSAPFAKVLETYLDITEVTVANVLNLVGTYYSPCEYSDWLNDDINFVIKIKKPTSPWYFGHETVKNRIKRVEIKCTAESTGDFVSSATYEPVISSQVPYFDHCYLKRVGTVLGQKDQYVGENPIKEMWMSIYWDNGRVTQVPIKRHLSGNGVDYNSLLRRYTITFKSATADEMHCADKIKLDD